MTDEQKRAKNFSDVVFAFDSGNPNIELNEYAKRKSIGGLAAPWLRMCSLWGHNVLIARMAGVTGEAAYQVSDELREKTPDIPWFIMIGMRNRLIHAYFDIDLNVVWSTSTQDVPLLIAELKKLLGQ